jgi:hypothetical protein
MTTQRLTRTLSHWLPDIASRESVPVSWLSTLHTRIKTEVPDGEESTCVVRGLHVATVTWDHTLSDVEQLQATVAEMQRKAAQIKALLPIEGGVSAAQADKMRELLG